MRQVDSCYLDETTKYPMTYTMCGAFVWISCTAFHVSVCFGRSDICACRQYIVFVSNLVSRNSANPRLPNIGAVDILTSSLEPRYLLRRRLSCVVGSVLRALPFLQSDTLLLRLDIGGCVLSYDAQSASAKLRPQSLEDLFNLTILFLPPLLANSYMNVCWHMVTRYSSLLSMKPICRFRRSNGLLCCQRLAAERSEYCLEHGSDLRSDFDSDNNAAGALVER